MTFFEILNELKQQGYPEKVKGLSHFFKTGKGQYGEGDIFIGVKVPEIRGIVGKYWDKLDMTGVDELVCSPYHEARLTGLLVLLKKYEKSNDESFKEQCINYYISHTQYVNNWDLVDLTCYKLLGSWLENRDRKILYDFSKSGNLWQERISIVTCLFFIKKNDFEDCKAISDILLNHKHDLIHKAVGWMLREMGKMDRNELVDYLKPRYSEMPRTMLRYSIEKFSQKERMQYLKGEI